MHVKHFGRVLKHAALAWRDNNATLIAAGLSFYATFSLIPALVIIAVVMRYALALNNANEALLEHVGRVFDPQAAKVLSGFLLSEQRGAPASLVGLLILGWAASRMMAQLQRALKIIWKLPVVAERTPLQHMMDHVRSRLRALGVTLGMIIIAALFFGLDVGLASLRRTPAGFLILNFAASFFLFALVSALVYKWLSKVDIGWGDVLLGAVVASLIFAIGRNVLSLYFLYTNFQSVFGVAGSIVILLMWIYFSMQVLLFGAEVAWASSKSEAKTGTVQ